MPAGTTDLRVATVQKQGDIVLFTLAGQLSSAAQLLQVGTAKAWRHDDRLFCPHTTASAPKLQGCALSACFQTHLRFASPKWTQHISQMRWEVFDELAALLVSRLFNLLHSPTLAWQSNFTSSNRPLSALPRVFAQHLQTMSASSDLVAALPPTAAQQLQTLAGTAATIDQNPNTPATLAALANPIDAVALINSMSQLSSAAAAPADEAAAPPTAQAPTSGAMSASPLTLAVAASVLLVAALL